MLSLMVMGRNRSPVLDRQIQHVAYRRVLLGGQYIDEPLFENFIWAARIDRNVMSELVTGQIDGVARNLVADSGAYLVRDYESRKIQIGHSLIDEDGQVGRVTGKEPLGRDRYLQVLWERA